MAPRQTQMFRRPQRRSRRSSGGGTGIIGILFVVIVLLFLLGLLAQFFETSSGGLTFIVIIGLLIASFVWRKRKREAQRQAWLIQQQQQAAWQQYQQQEALRQQYVREEWERREEEKQEQEKIARMKSLGDILILTPKEFEQLTKRILEHNGVQHVQHTGKSGDLGADLIGFDVNGNQIIVQCKRYAPGNTIGSPEIQKFIGMMNVHHKAQKGIFVTTTKFSQPARDLAAQHNILLIDGDKLVNILQGKQYISF